MKNKVISVFVSCILSVTGMPILLPVSDANAVTEITAEQLKSVQNFILGNSEGVTTAIDKTFDVNNDNRIDSFDLCILRKNYAEQEKSKNFYSLSSDMVNENDSMYGSLIMSDEFHSKRVITKADTVYDFSGFSSKKVINGPDNLYVLQFETVENAEFCMNTLRKDKHIEYVELDEYMNCEEIETEQADSVSWGVGAIEADKYSEYLGNNYDSSVVVAVVDTGVAYHDLLQGRILDTGYDLVDNDSDPNDKHFHGTHVAGTVVDCTPNLNINIMPVRVLDENGNGSTLNVGNGIRFAAENGADVINLSLGGKGNSRYIDDSIEYAVENGVTVVVAAGNKGDNTINYCPAHLDNCIVVSACDSENNKANFSNYGNSVDVTAPGVDIRSCIPGGSFKSLNGTSMATPHISAAAAMIKYADKNATPAQIEQTIKDISLDLGDRGKDVYYGYGLPKLSKLINETSPEIIDSGKCGDNAYYTLDENGLLTISGTGNMWDWTNSYSIPWYSICDEIKNITIEYGVESIGRLAFEDCINLTSISIPNSVTTISSGAFISCTSLETITIPKSVTEFSNFGQYPWRMFNNCTNLKEIKVDKENQCFTSIDGVLFNKDKSELISYPQGKEDLDYSVSDSVKSIGNGAFYKCNNLIHVIIPESVTKIGGYSFYESTALKEVDIPDSVSEIGIYAFNHCTNLQSAYIPANIESLNNIYDYCDSLSYINVSTSNLYFSDIEGVVFDKAKKKLIIYPAGRTDKKYIIPDGVTTIVEDAFSSSDYIEEVIIPNSVTTLEKAAFSSCSNLDNIILPSSITIIPDTLFSQCKKLSNISILGNITSIGQWSFMNTRIKSITIPASCNEIGTLAFYQSSLKDIYILNPSCYLQSHSNLMPSSATIYGYKSSTAQAYAEEYNRTFVALD
ncbi:MAG: leucine-rich repeat protein [Ruminococcus sp.]|nr:leucine-rich repeat protein [Ruminococcus sp.]